MGLGPKSYSLLVSPDPRQEEYERTKTEERGDVYKPEFHIRSDGLGEIKKAKGVAGVAVSTIDFTNYLTTLLNETLVYKSFNSLRSVNHVVHQIRTTKKALTPLDTKRYLLSCGVHSVPYGHYRVENDNDTCHCDRNGI